MSSTSDKFINIYLPEVFSRINVFSPFHPSFYMFTPFKSFFSFRTKSRNANIENGNYQELMDIKESTEIRKVVAKSRMRFH